MPTAARRASVRENDSWPSTIRQRRECTVVVALEPALDDLAERDEREHLARCPSVDVSGMSASRSTSTISPVSSSTVAPSRAMSANGIPFRAAVREGLGGHRRPFMGRAVAHNEKDRPRAVCVWDREHTAVSGRATTW